MKNKGFSFIEILVVLVLLSLTVALMGPSLSQFLRSVELKAAAKKVSGILRYYRSEAVNKGKVYQVFFNPDLRVVKVQSMESEEGKTEDEHKGNQIHQKMYSLPEGIQIKEVKVESSQSPSDLPVIEFYPNGGSNGGSILLGSQHHRGYRIKIHFITGGVVIEKV